MFKKLFLNDLYYNTIPNDDLIAKQRYKLFRTTSIVGTLACFLFVAQSAATYSFTHPIVLVTSIIGSIFFINLVLLPIHKKNRTAYVIINILSILLIHLIMYYSGGIKASASYYLAPITLMGFMLLGNKTGRILFLFVAANIVYFFCITEYTTWVTYDLIGNTPHLINLDYLITGLFAFFILASQMNYLESGKNIVIERITAQRNELRSKNKELRKLSIVASKAENAIIITDKNGFAEWVNDGFVRLTGYGFEEVVGKNAAEMLSGKNSDQTTLEELKNCIIKRQPFTGEVLKYHKDGTKFWTQVTMTPIVEEENNETKFIFIESNVTVRKVAEEKMKQYMDNLEKSNAELDKFAYVVSHDLKAPLRAIGNLTGWIEEDMGEKLDNDIRGHFNTIKGRVLRMEGLINGILDYTKAAKDGANIETFSAEELVRDSIDLIGAPANAVINIRENMPVMNSEKVKIQQLFLNLIHNAVKYNDKEDIQVEIGVEDKGKEWQFYVKDNGPGIEQRYHEKIFVIFQTLNARDEVESRGVGLAIVKKIIEEAGGKIWVESEKGKGAAFYFTWLKEKKKNVEETLMLETSA